MEAERWIRGRLGAAPASLIERMVEAVRGRDGAAAEAMADGAVELYAEVAAGAGGREDAFPLLAADALLTHAFQAQAELDPGRVPALAERIGASGLLGATASRVTG
jgi:hypothetical protein